MVTFQICSDLKISSVKEYNKLNEYIKPCGDILLVSGNISRPNNFSRISIYIYEITMIRN